MARAWRRAERDHRLADGGRQNNPHAPALPLSSRGAVQRHRQHRPSRKLHLPPALAAFSRVTMRDAFGLFLIVGKAAIIVTGGCFVFLLMAVLIGFRPEPLLVEKAILGAVIVLLPTGVSVWWTFRKLRKLYARREARAVCIAFAVFTPVSLLVAFGLGPLFGYVQISGAPQVIGVLSVFMGI